MVARGSGWREGLNTKGQLKGIPQVCTFFCILSVVVVTRIQAYIKTHKTFRQKNELHCIEMFELV